MLRSNTESLSEILKKFIRKNRLEDGIDSSRISKIWEDVTGKYIAVATSNIEIKNRKLFVNINSSLLRNEILLIKSELIKRINEKIGRKFIDDIIVR